MKDDFECQTESSGRSFGSKLLERIWLTIGAVVLFFLFVVTMAALGSEAQAAPPDPWVRMTSPSGCSGGVFHADRQYGIFISTCKHCVNRPGRVKLVFFKDGQRATVEGQFLKSHRKRDCAVVWVSPNLFYELPQVVPIAGPDIGPFKGQAVYAVGSYAGGTVTPAMRHLSIISVDQGAYQFRLNDHAWGGHSGGPVVDAWTGYQLGNLWGTSGRESLVTSNRALTEVMYEFWTNLYSERYGQAMYSVVDEIEPQQVASSRPDIKVRANRHDIDQIRKEVRASHYLNRHFDFDFDTEWFRKTPRIEWEVNGQTWYIDDGWKGQDDFIRRFQKTGGRFT